MARNVNLDILAFWKSNDCRYPNLATMARDILSIPVSIVTSKASFSVRGHVLDQYYSTLKADAMKAIIYLRDWLGGVKGYFETNRLLFRLYIKLATLIFSL